MAVAPEKLGKYLLLIVIGLVLIAMFFLPEGQFGKVKGAFDNTKNTYLPDITLGQSPLQGSQPVIPSEHREQINSLKQAMSTALYSEKRNCFAQYTPFSVLGEKGTSFVLYYNGDGSDLIVYGGVGGAQEVSREHFIGIKPCVIAGDSQTVENFDHAFLNKEEGVPSSYFTDVNFIRIAFDTSWNDQNRIAFGNSQDQLTNYYNFGGDGWLFTPDNAAGNKRICFFPTEPGVGLCEAQDNALDTDCFSGDDFQLGIPTQIQAGSLDQC